MLFLRGGDRALNKRRRLEEADTGVRRVVGGAGLHYWRWLAGLHQGKMEMLLVETELRGIHDSS